MSAENSTQRRLGDYAEDQTLPAVSDDRADETIRACPECDSARISTAGTGPQGRDADHDWRCRECLARFDEPVTRERQGSGSVNGLARKLDQADPKADLDDVGRPITDGGTTQWGEPYREESGYLLLIAVAAIFAALGLMMLLASMGGSL